MINRVSDRIVYLEQDTATDRPHLGLVMGQKYAFMVDAGNSAAHMNQFLQETKGAGLPAPDYVGVTHYHWDHSFGMWTAPCPTVACRATAQKLAEMRRMRWDDEALDERFAAGTEKRFSMNMIKAEYPNRDELVIADPDIVFEGTLRFDLGGLHLELIHIGGPHSRDGVVVFVPEEKFLFLGDSNGRDMDALDWDYDPDHPETLQDILATLPYNKELLAPYVAALEKLDFTTCLSGHLNPIPKKEFISGLKKHL